MKYASQEFYDQVKEASLTDRMWRETARGFTARWQNLLLDCPGGVDKLVDWEVRNTKVVSVVVQEKPAPSDFRTLPVDEGKFLGRFVAPYASFVRLHKQEFSAMVALGMGVYDIEGDITEVMKQIESFDAFVDVSSTVPAEYD